MEEKMAAKYPELKNYILEQISQGNFKKGVMLPSEKEFTELFKVSRMTVRRAFDDLIQDGVLIRKAGSGVFVANNKIERSLTRISISHDEAIHQMYNKLTVKIIDYKIVRNHHIAREYLGIEDEDVIQVKRVQLGDGCPIVYENIFLPVKYFDKIEKEEFINSLQQVVDQHFLKKDKQLQNEITVEAKLATKTLSSLLQVPINSPILQLKIVVKGEDGERFYCGIDSYSGDSFQYCG